MLKKFTKGLLEKEVIAQNREASLPIDRLLQSSYAASDSSFTSFAHTFSKEEKEEEEQDTFSDSPDIFIGENTVIKGSLSFDTLLRVDGTFEGELTSKGKIIVGPKGTVKGDIDLEEAFIAGTVVGNITVTKRLALRGRASVKGDITGPIISVDEGVSIEGKLSISQHSPSSEETADKESIEEELF